MTSFLGLRPNPPKKLFEKSFFGNFKNFCDGKKLRFLPETPKSQSKTAFSTILLLCFFLSKKEAGFQGAAPLGENRFPHSRRALPCTRLKTS